MLTTPAAGIVKRNLATARSYAAGGGNAWMQGMAPPPHMTPEFEAQMRNHVQGGGALPAGVLEMPPHVVQQLQSQMPAGMHSQCPQQ
jgi:hypothetical protein